MVSTELDALCIFAGLSRRADGETEDIKQHWEAWPRARQFLKTRLLVYRTAQSTGSVVTSLGAGARHGPAPFGQGFPLPRGR